MNNVVEKFKKGNKIHIKESQKGSFTKWCGGNVTSECILKGKNSSNPKIRKKATFAANARKWKHLNGGILKAEDGTKVNTFLKIGNWLNSDTGKAISGTLLNGLSAGFLAKLMNDFINEYDAASKAKLKSLLNVSSKDYISKALSTMNPNENLSSLVLLKRAYDIGMLEALKAYNEEKENIDLLMFNLKQYASLLNLNNFFNAFSQLGNLLNYTNKKTTDNGAPSNDNT